MHRWDHTGGIRTVIDEGAIIVTQESSQELLQRIATSPHTINPYRSSKSTKPLKLQTVGKEGELTDGTPTIKLYTVNDQPILARFLVADISGNRTEAITETTLRVRR